MKSTRPAALLAALILLAVLGAASPAASQAAATEDRSPTGVVASFYSFHLAHDMGFSAGNVSRRAAWLSPGFLTLCKAYFARPSSPDLVPGVDGDPFTDSQEYPETFQVGQVRHSGNGATVTVSLSGRETRPRSVRVVLVLVKGSWLIDDVRYGSGPSFRPLLQP